MTARSLAAPAWALLALFVVYACAGTWAGDGPRIWAPILISWTDVAQNFVVYLPFGILGVLTLRQRRHTLLASVTEVAVITALFSLIIEVSQLYTINRIASLTDVLVAVIGAAAGGAIAGPAARIAERAADAARPSGVFESPDRPVLIALVIALAIVAWWPFDPTLDVSTLAARWRATERDPWMIDGVTAGVQALLYAWLSLAVAVCSYRLSTLKGMFVGVAAATTAAVVIDAGQLAMGSQPIGFAGLGSQIAGAIAGGTAFAVFRVPM